MTPEEVPDDLLDMAHKAMRFSDESDIESGLAVALAAILPGHERQLRKQIVKELEAAHGPLDVNDLVDGEFDEGVQAAINTVRIGGAS